MALLLEVTRRLALEGGNTIGSPANGVFHAVGISALKKKIHDGLL